VVLDTVALWFGIGWLVFLLGVLVFLCGERRWKAYREWKEACRLEDIRVERYPIWKFFHCDRKHQHHG
jgi:hypothetical protein